MPRLDVTHPSAMKFQAGMAFGHARFFFVFSDQVSIFATSNPKQQS